MFTGLIEAVGTIAELTTLEGGAKLFISCPAWEDPLHSGESISVEGTCLTVTQFSDKGFSCDLLAETWERTNLSARIVGDSVNLERAVRVGDRMGGHYVSGHVDATGLLNGVDPVGEDVILTISAPEEFMKGVVYKGSISINGISLTVSRVGNKGFDVCIIPHTWENTTLKRYCVGDELNLEADLIGKHVLRYLESMEK